MGRVFVAPSAQGKGLGRRPVCDVERLARSDKVVVRQVPAPITAEGFDARLGSRPVRVAVFGDERTIIMQRVLGPPRQNP